MQLVFFNKRYFIVKVLTDIVKTFVRFSLEVYTLYRGDGNKDGKNVKREVKLESEREREREKPSFGS